MNISLSITKNIHDWLFNMMPEGVANIVEMVLIAIVYLAIFAIAGLYLVLLERRVAAWFQLRIGPNRVGFQGLLQTMADALKLVSKELTTFSRHCLMARKEVKMEELVEVLSQWPIKRPISRRNTSPVAKKITFPSLYHHHDFT